LYFFQKRNNRKQLELFGGKTPELKDRLTMLAMVGRSAGCNFVRREVGIFLLLRQD